MTKTDFRKALAQADRCKPFYYTETSRSGHEYKYCFLKAERATPCATRPPAIPCFAAITASWQKKSWFTKTYLFKKGVKNYG